MGTTLFCIKTISTTIKNPFRLFSTTDHGGPFSKHTAKMGNRT